MREGGGRFRGSRHWTRETKRMWPARVWGGEGEREGGLVVQEPRISTYRGSWRVCCGNHPVQRESEGRGRGGCNSHTFARSADTTQATFPDGDQHACHFVITGPDARSATAW